jgi:hypothetical protein
VSPRARRGLLVAVAGLAGAALVALAILQAVAPSIAARNLRHRLERSGHVDRVEVHAFPAVKLLWDRADRVVVRMRDAGPGPGRLADLLADTRDVDRLDARVDQLRILTLRLRDAELHKRGPELTGSASVTEPDLRAALPPGFDVRPIASGGGELVLEGTATIFGRRLSARAVVAARDGRLVIVPDVPFGGLLTLTLFADPRVVVTGVSAQAAPGGGFRLAADGRVSG